MSKFKMNKDQVMNWAAEIGIRITDYAPLKGNFLAILPNNPDLNLEFPEEIQVQTIRHSPEVNNEIWCFCQIMREKE